MSTQPLCNWSTHSKTRVSLMCPVGEDSTLLTVTTWWCQLSNIQMLVAGPSQLPCHVSGTLCLTFVLPSTQNITVSAMLFGHFSHYFVFLVFWHCAQPWIFTSENQQITWSPQCCKPGRAFPNISLSPIFPQVSSGTEFHELKAGGWLSTRHK